METTFQEVDPVNPVKKLTQIYAKYKIPMEGQIADPVNPAKELIQKDQLNSSLRSTTFTLEPGLSVRDIAL